MKILGWLRKIREADSDADLLGEADNDTSVYKRMGLAQVQMVVSNNWRNLNGARKSSSVNG
jgi:hypothetical protein